MKYQSRKGFIVPLLIVVFLTATITTFHQGVYVISAIMLAVLAYCIWMWFATYYIIEGKQLYYQSALFKGTVDIHTIFEVVKNTSQYSGIKASLSTKGIIIKFNKWDDIYISPSDADQFISELKAINPEIKISG